MELTEYITSERNRYKEIDDRLLQVEQKTEQNTQDIADNTDAIAELGELIGGEING